MRLAWAGACVLALATASPALGAAPSGARSCTGCHSPAGPGAALEGLWGLLRLEGEPPTKAMLDGKITANGAS